MISVGWPGFTTSIGTFTCIGGGSGAAGSEKNRFAANPVRQASGMNHNQPGDEFLEDFGGTRLECDDFLKLVKIY